MSPENEQRLRAKHPRLFAKPTGKAAMVPFAVDGFAVGDGWLAILDEMAAEIEQTCAVTGSKLPTVLQIKEKFGALRIYVSGANDAVDAIIARAEERSASDLRGLRCAGKPPPEWAGCARSVMRTTLPSSWLSLNLKSASGLAEL